MKVKVDYANIEKSIRAFTDDEDLLNFIKDEIDSLYRHNKNYNQWQWITIQNLKDIFDNIEL